MGPDPRKPRPSAEAAAPTDRATAPPEPRRPPEGVGYPFATADHRNGWLLYSRPTVVDGVASDELSTGYLLRDALAQALILLLLAVGVGVGIGVGLGSMIGGTAPFALNAGSIGTASVLLVLLGVVGALGAVLRITAVDPLTALGGSR